KDGYSSFSKDKNNVYYIGDAIKGADPETFEFIDSQYMKDKNSVYYVHNGVKKFEGVDPKHLRC
ncbi:hypothetical protein GWN26_10530, partial [Candidatus Saccharibacteria bacterium]|nr:hypothetical protein [Candidatus Saccharibacteria bacterium]NIW79820.1 hypothetical protein [Calditrichia bacterium]